MDVSGTVTRRALEGHHDTAEQTDHHGTTPARSVTTGREVVTGAAGRLGRAVVIDLVAHGRDVLVGPALDVPPPYVPIDERYRARPESTSSLVKALDDEKAHHPCRRDAHPRMIELRVSNVTAPGAYEAFPSFDADAQLRKENLWAYIDARDGVHAVRRARPRRRGPGRVHRRHTGTVMSRSSAELVAEVHPETEVCGVRSSSPGGPRKPGVTGRSRRDRSDHEIITRVDE